MLDDPFDPYATTNNYNAPYGDPQDDGWWALVNGVWRWISEPLPRPTTDPA